MCCSEKDFGWINDNVPTCFTSATNCNTKPYEVEEESNAYVWWIVVLTIVWVAGVPYEVKRRRDNPTQNAPVQMTKAEMELELTKMGD